MNPQENLNNTTYLVQEEPSKKEKIVLKLNKKINGIGWGWKTFLVCLGLSCVFFLPIIFMNGGIFTYMGDYNAQQIPFYVHCHRAIREGNIVWDWGTELGTGFLGSYTYYTLCSPFFWLTLPFPTSWVPYLMGPLFILKFGLSGLTAFLYIKNHVKRERSAFLGGILYAFSGWSVYNIFYNQFHESFILFPLLLLTLDNLVEKNKYGYFALMVLVCAFTNYYFFVGMAVFCVIYWLVRTLTGSWKMTVGKTLVIAFEAIFGTLCAAFILLPSAITVFSMDRTAGSITGIDMLIYPDFKVYISILQSMFFPAEIPALQGFLYNKNTAWQSLTLYLPLVGFVGVFAWIKNRIKSWQSVLLLTSLVFAFIPILNASFTMFQPIYYARWYMMPILIMCLATVKAAEELDIEKFKGPYKLISVITLLFILVFAFCPNIYEGEWVFGLYSRFNELTPYLFVIWSCVAVLQLVALYFAYLKEKNVPLIDNKRIYKYLCYVIIGILVFTSLFGYNTGGKARIALLTQNVKSAFSVMEDEDARVGVYCGSSEFNINMTAGRDSIDCFHSLTSQGTIRFYDTMLGYTRTVTSPKILLNTEAKTLLSTRYLYVKKAYIDNLFDYSEEELKDELMDSELFSDRFEKYGYALNDGYTKIAESKEYIVYENDNYLSYGIPFSQYITEENYEKLSKEEKNAVMLKALVISKDDVQKVSDIMTEYLSDDRSLKDVCDSLSDKTCNQFEKTSDGFTASVTSDKEQYIFFSVPYEEGAWTAKINGEEAEIITVDGGLMSVRVYEGKNDITFTYEVPGFKLGAAFSCIAGVILLLYGALIYASKKYD